MSSERDKLALAVTQQKKYIDALQLHYHQWAQQVAQQIGKEGSVKKTLNSGELDGFIHIQSISIEFRHVIGVSVDEGQSRKTLNFTS